MSRTSAIVAALLLVVLTAVAVGATNERPAAPVDRDSMRPAPPALGSWQLAETRSVGLGWDGSYIWVSAGDQDSGHCTFYTYTCAGALHDSWYQQGATGWGYRDLTYSGTYMWGSQCYWIRAFDGWGGYQGYFVGPINPCRALAYDGTHWYTSGFGEYIYRGRWNGVWGSTPIWQQWNSQPIYGAFGMAYDQYQGCFWLTETGATSGYLYKYNTNGAVIEQYQFPPEYSSPAGCTMVNTDAHGYVLAVLQQGTSNDSVVYYDVGSSPVEGKSWGKIKRMYR